MKNVLFISYFFSPNIPNEGGGGIQRNVKFIKYLERKGWNISVITASYSNVFPDFESVGNKISTNLQINTVKGITFYNIIEKLDKFNLHIVSSLINKLAIPDHYILWLKPAYILAKKLILRDNIQILFTTSSPVTSHLIGILLKRKFGKKIFWVADFRDPWSLNKIKSKNLMLYQKLINNFLEKKVLRSCDHAIHTTELNRINTIDVFKIHSSKVSTIYNGYDEEDFQNNMLEPKKHSNFFNIVYSGDFYLDYNPGIFLNSVKEFLIQKDNIRITFVGTGSHWVRTFLDREKLINKLSNRIVLLNHVDHIRSINYLCNADLLLLFLPNYMDYCIPGKLFEYIRSNIPILALVPKNGETAKIINQVNAGYVVEPEDVDKILADFKQIYYKWELNQLHFKSNIEEIEKFNRSYLTDQLINIFLNGLHQNYSG